jgi:hypothetical protein
MVVLMPATFSIQCHEVIAVQLKLKIPIKKSPKFQDQSNNKIKGAAATNLIRI